MLANAIRKINDEMKQGNNPYVQVVGTFLLQHLDKNPHDAEKILNPNKSIVKSLNEMRKVAEKKKVGNCAVLTDREGFDIVLKYFDIKGEPVSMTDNTPTPADSIKQTPNFDIRLEDLL